MYKYSTKFDGLNLEGDNYYTITVSTELDGKTITQICLQTERPSGASKDGPSTPKTPKDGKPPSDSKPTKKKWEEMHFPGIESSILCKLCSKRFLVSAKCKGLKASKFCEQYFLWRPIKENLRTIWLYFLFQSYRARCMVGRGYLILGRPLATPLFSGQSSHEGVIVNYDSSVVLTNNSFITNLRA